MGETDHKSMFDAARLPAADKPWFAPRSASPERRAEQIYRRLRQAILRGDILARTRLIETEVAEKLGSSRTPVREAISKLERDGLVVPLISGGVEVVDTAREMGDICYIREALEGTAARLAASRIQESELRRLEELLVLSRNLSNNEYQNRVVLNNEFHEIIFKASRSERLVQMIGSFREFFASEKSLGKYNKKDTETALKHHEQIVQALRAGDGKRVEMLVRRHIEHGWRRVRGAANR